MIRFCTLFTLAFCMNFSAVFSQGLNFININTDNGLPSNECYRIVQDKKGYIWIATEAGLVKYNSKDFMLFNTSKGMPSVNDIYALAVDNEDRLWFATGSWKVGYIQNDIVHVLEGVDLFLGSQKKSDIIYKMFFDKKTQAVHVCSNYQTTIIKEKKEKFISTAIQSIQSRNCHFYLNSGHIANSYSKSLSKTVNSISEPTFFVDSRSVQIPIYNQQTKSNQLFSDSIDSRTICLGTSNSLLLFDRKEQAFTLHKKLANEIISLKCSEQILMVGCKRGGLLLYGRKPSLSEKPLCLLESLSVSNILEDSEGGIWVTTLEKGIFYSANPFVHKLEIIDGSASSLTFSKVIDTTLFLSNPNVPLAIVNKGLTLFSKLAKETLPRITDVIVLKKQIYIGTEAGSYLMAKNKKSVTPLYTEDIDEHNTVRKVPVSSKGLLIDSSENVYNYNNIYVLKFKHGKYLGHITNEEKIKHVLLLNRDHALIASSNKLFLYSLYNAELTPIKTASNLHLQNINKIFKDSYGNHWILEKNDTLTILNKQFNLLAQLASAQKNNINYRDILQLNSKEFYVATNKGLFVVTFKTNHFSDGYTLRLFDETNGLTSSDVFSTFLFDKKLHISTSKGICYTDTIQKLQHRVCPNTAIKCYWVNDTAHNDLSQKIFDYKSNNVAFQVDALTFKKVGQRGFFYKYKLEGWDKEFKTATGNTVSYSNLPPGNYTFVAKAFYDQETEDPTPATFSFTIQPAIWQTWWGISLILIAFLGGLFLYVQSRIRKIRKVEKEKAAINQTIAEYRFTALKAQMDPHFVFNSVNVIQNLILERDKTEAYNSLEKFAKLIRMVLNQSDSVFATIEEELALIDLYIDLNLLRVDHPFSFVKNIQPAALQCQVPSLIIQPFIENALWHGILPLKGIRKGIIELKIFIEDEKNLVIELRDNGVGRKAKENKLHTSKHISKGNKLIEERLEAYKSMNNSNQASLRIIDLEENGTPVGTLVQIKISMQELD